MKKIVVILNLSGLVYKNYHFCYGNGDTMKVLMNSDWNKFGGTTKDTEKTIKGSMEITDLTFRHSPEFI